MAIINSYPIGTPKTNDLLVGTSMPDVNTDNDPRTVNFPISNISTLITANSVENSADIWPSTPKVTQVVTMTQAEYDQGGALNPNWLVIIVG